MPRIAICGRKGSGKSTFSAFLRELDPRHEEHAFADPLKDQVAELLEIARIGFAIPYGEPITRAYTDAHRDQFAPVWQWYGTEFARTANNDYWVDLFERTYGHLEHVIVPDFRFPNEAQAVQRMGFLLVRVEGHDRRPGDLRDPHHASEQHWESLPYDVIIENYGSREELRHQAEHLLWDLDIANAEAGSIV